MSVNGGLGLDYSMYLDDFLYDQQMRYANYGTGAYYNQYGGADMPLFTNYNQSTVSSNGYTCTDGQNDGKLGISALWYAGKGVVKGAINGVKGMFTDSSGKFSLAKTLGTVALGAACVACPALGAVACGIGAVAGGAQLVNGFKNVAAAKDNMSDAQAKEAWENIGEGTATVVGCVTGAVASVGAMKAASTAAKLSSIDDIGKFLGNTDDIAKALGNTDDMVKALKAHGINNTDEVIKALDGVDNIDDAMKAITSTGKTSALGAVDDTLTGTKKAAETLKAAGKDAMSSSKNNVGKVWNKATSTIDDVSDYRKAKKAYKDYQKAGGDEALNKAQTDFDEAFKQYQAVENQKGTKAYDEALAKTNEASKNLKEIKAKRSAVRRIENGSAANSNGTLQAKHNIEAQNKIAAAGKEVQAKQSALDDAIKAAKETDEVKNIKKYTDRKAKVNEIVKPQQEALDAAKAAEQQAKSQTMFGQFKANITSPIKNSETIKYLTQNEKGSIIKMLKDKTFDWSAFKDSFSADYADVISFLQADTSDYSKAVSEFGWQKVNNVLQTIYGLNQTGMVI